jgi:hypothetical protein
MHDALDSIELSISCVFRCSSCIPISKFQSVEELRYQHSPSNESISTIRTIMITEITVRFHSPIEVVSHLSGVLFAEFQHFLYVLPGHLRNQSIFAIRASYDDRVYYSFEYFNVSVYFSGCP